MPRQRCNGQAALVADSACVLRRSVLLAYLVAGVTGIQKGCEGHAQEPQRRVCWRANGLTGPMNELHLPA